MLNEGLCIWVVFGIIVGGYMKYINLFNRVNSFLNGFNTDLSSFSNDGEFIKEFFRIILYAKFWEAFRYDNIHLDSGKELKNVNVNLAKAFVDRSVDFLFGKPFSVYAPENYSKLMAPVINYINKKVGIELFALEVGINGSVCGDSFVKVFWDENIQCSRFQLLDSSKTFVKYKTSDRSRSVLEEAVITWDGYAVCPDGIEREVLFKEVWTDEYKRVFFEYIKSDKKTIKHYPEKLFKQLFKFSDVDQPSDDSVEEVLVSEVANDLGFIPIVHFKNQIIPLEIYGRSDIADIVDLNFNLNEAVTQFLDSVKYHGSPITLIFGAKIGNLRRGPNKIWSGFPKDAKVDQLGGTQNFPALNDLIEQLQDFAYLVSSIPEVSSGLFQNISNATGVALQVQYLPLIGLTRRKRLAYEAGFVQLYEYALKLLDRNLNLDLQKRVNDYVALRNQIEELRITKEIEVAETTDTRLDDLIALEDDMVFKLYSELAYNPFYKVEIKWGEFLPRDSMQELQEIQMELEMGIESKKGAMRRRGIKDIDAKFKEIEEDKLFEVGSMANFSADNLREILGSGFAAEEGSAALSNVELPTENESERSSEIKDVEMEEYRKFKSQEQQEAKLIR